MSIAARMKNTITAQKKKGRVQRNRPSLFACLFWVSNERR